MKNVEEILNSLTDKDWGWWPVIHLRPPKDKDIDNSVLLKLTPVFGSFAAILLTLIDPPITIRSFIFYLVVSWVGFFLLYKYTFALAWNQRAKRLRESNLDDS